ncbi:MAG: NAD(P)/FAD-dependent oxidoreductase [Caulobacterales bacterium]
MKRIAVLGAGIMGVSTALFLARRGAAVTLYDRAPAPLMGASRWNEGKIHLGFLYSGDRTLRTAERLIPGGLAFRPLVEELIGGSLEAAPTTDDDIYLCHRESVTGPEAMEAYCAEVAERVRAHPDAGRYLADVTRCATTRLTAAELAQITDSPAIVAGFRAPERSVSTTWIAERLAVALAAEPGIELRLGAPVTAAQPLSPGEPQGRWRVTTADGAAEVFDAVVNALWEGRLAIDATAGLAPAGAWSHRYRLGVFLRTAEPLAAASATIAVGPFGDLKAYGGRDFYLSWYLEGLRVDSGEVEPPRPPGLSGEERGAMTRAILDHLQSLLPAVAAIRAGAVEMALEGGWVFALGGGQLSDPASTLHRRADFGVTELGAYVSVDTGKYSTAPWLAHRLAERLA